MRGDLCEGIVTIKIEEGNQRAVSLNQKSQFGKLSEDCLELSIIEACYLMESGRLDIYENDKKCDVNYIIDLIKEDEIYGKYLVYRDLIHAHKYPQRQQSRSPSCILYQVAILPESHRNVVCEVSV